MPDLLMPPATLRKCLWLGAVVGLVLYCRHFWPVGPGAKLYLEAAQCMWDGLPLQQCNKFFTYPPIVAFVMVPLLAMPAFLINIIWYVLTLGAIVGCFQLSAALVQRLIPADWPYRDLTWLYLIGIGLSLKFLFAAIGNQSYDALVVLAALGGIYWLSERPAWAGAAFGVAAALKATPLVFLPYLLFTRRFSAAAIMTIAALVLTVLPDLVFTQAGTHGPGGYVMSWLNGVAGAALTEHLERAPHIFWSAMSATNYSLRGLVGYFRSDGDPTFRLIVYAVYAVYAAIVAVIVLRSYRRPWAITTDGALLLLSMLLMSPMTSATHFLALILCYMAIAAVWLKGDARMRPLAGFFLLLVFVTTNLSSDDLVGRTVTTWSHQYRVMVYGMLALLIFFAIYVDRRMRAEARSRSGRSVAATEPLPG